MPRKNLPLGKNLINAKSFMRPLRVSVAGALMASLLLTACEPSLRLRGNLLQAERLEQIKVNKSTRDDVQAILGSPSAIASFDPNRWYYIGERTSQTAFFNPTVTERRIYQLSFDKAGKLASIEELTEEAAQKVEMSSRQTPTGGRELTVMQQLLGNLGRFNAPSNE